MSTALSPIHQPIIVRPYRNGWQAYEGDGAQPYYLNFDDAMDAARFRASYNARDVIVRDANGAELQRIKGAEVKRF